LRIWIILRVLAVLMFVTIPFWSAGAQSLIDRLVMPGQLTKAHIKEEKDCNNCHEAFSKSSQMRLCLACHKDVAADRNQKRGLHGMRPDAVNAECKHCHTEHKGREADIVQFDRETFNHKFTNFELRGSHRPLRCDSCHKAGEKFRKTKGKCVDCHKKAEPHKGRLGDKCDGCHDEEHWAHVKPFDHSKTKFPLDGAHKKVTCAACHPGEKYKDVPLACAGCHQLQDHHAGRYGTKCEKCHVSEKWKTIRFDHNKTKFPLKGSHTNVKCDTCHTGQDLYRDKLPTDCNSCHKKNDPHKGQLGTNCAKCHNETSWRKKVAFDHDLSRFPLIGQHAVVACEECHKTQSFKEVPKKCVECHKDTHHEGRLGENCVQCHNPNAWRLWRFDHDKQTQFPLTGAHKGLSCHACHNQKNVAKIVMSKACHDCHAKDDAHHGNFGWACEKCHTTASWKQGGMRR
jgi:hypothetical protein